MEAKRQHIESLRHASIEELQGLSELKVGALSIYKHKLVYPSSEPFLWCDECDCSAGIYWAATTLL